MSYKISFFQAVITRLCLVFCVSLFGCNSGSKDTQSGIPDDENHVGGESNSLDTKRILQYSVVNEQHTIFLDESLDHISNNDVEIEYRLVEVLSNPGNIEACNNIEVDYIERTLHTTISLPSSCVYDFAFETSIGEIGSNHAVVNASSDTLSHERYLDPLFTSTSLDSSQFEVDPFQGLADEIIKDFVLDDSLIVVGSEDPSNLYVSEQKIHITPSSIGSTTVYYTLVDTINSRSLTGSLFLSTSIGNNNSGPIITGIGTQSIGLYEVVELDLSPLLDDNEGDRVQVVQIFPSKDMDASIVSSTPNKVTLKANKLGLHDLTFNVTDHNGGYASGKVDIRAFYKARPLSVGGGLALPAPLYDKIDIELLNVKPYTDSKGLELALLDFPSAHEFCHEIRSRPISENEFYYLLDNFDTHELESLGWSIEKPYWLMPENPNNVNNPLIPVGFFVDGSVQEQDRSDIDAVVSCFANEFDSFKPYIEPVYPINNNYEIYIEGIKKNELYYDDHYDISHLTKVDYVAENDQRLMDIDNWPVIVGLGESIVPLVLELAVGSVDLSEELEFRFEPRENFYCNHHDAGENPNVLERLDAFGNTVFVMCPIPIIDVQRVLGHDKEEFAHTIAVSNPQVSYAAFELEANYLEAITTACSKYNGYLGKSWVFPMEGTELSQVVRNAHFSNEARYREFVADLNGLDEHISPAFSYSLMPNPQGTEVKIFHEGGDILLTSGGTFNTYCVAK